jgi:ABC-type transporter Mla subunit MlaD
MESNKQEKELIEKQFQELLDKAKELYPNIDEAVATLNNMTAQTTNLQDYLNLTLQTPSETSNNQISFD